MVAGATPKIRLSLSEWGQMLIAFTALAWPMTKALFGNAPWNMFGSREARRDYWRNIALVMIRTGGYWFSIRHLQYLMPNDHAACHLWSTMNWTSVTSEKVGMVGSVVESTILATERNPWIHWVGPMPVRVGTSSTSNGPRRGQAKSKVVLYIHGGGFVLPLSNGSITMMKTLLMESNAIKKDTPVYLALAEYTISPYAEYPTQIRQCISIIQFLHSNYNIDSSNLVLAGDSCGGSLCISLISHLLHPSPTLPALPYVKGTSAPLAGILLISPWTSFATTSPSYTANADSDTLPPNVIRRFRDTYMPKASALQPGYKRMDPMEVASLSGRFYKSIPDPPIRCLDRGAGATRPLDSFTSDITDNDGWWNEVGSVVQKMMITAGEHECFRDDIIKFAANLKQANGTPNTEGNNGTAAEIELVIDESFHAVLVSDFAFGIPPSTLAAKLSGWLVNTLRD